jgi:hypothetical protein
MGKETSGKTPRRRKRRTALPDNVIDLQAARRARGERTRRMPACDDEPCDDDDRLIVTLWDAALALAHLQHQGTAPFAARDLARGLREAAAQTPVADTVEVMRGTWALIEEANWMQVRIDAIARFRADHA